MAREPKVRERRTAEKLVSLLQVNENEKNAMFIHGHTISGTVKLFLDELVSVFPLSFFFFFFRVIVFAVRHEAALWNQADEEEQDPAVRRRAAH